MALAAAPTSAQTLSIALAAPITSLDPHFHDLTPNNNVADHVFEKLVAKDGKERLVPALAEQWTAVDELTWEFRLRRGVRWHDGSAFTAADVIASLRRAGGVQDSPASFAPYVRSVAALTAPDPLTLRIRTHRPDPLLPRELVAVRIMPARLAGSAATGDFEQGRAMIGTGPFRFKAHVPGEHVLLERFDGYWGPRPAWRHVVLRFIGKPEDRLGALRRGEVQVIDGVPPAEVDGLRRDARWLVSSAISNRLIYLHMDSDRDHSPHVTGRDGTPLTSNPLRDVRVRKAISLAIDRDAIVSRVLNGQGVPAGQLLPEIFAGTSRRLPAPKPDLDAARKLLAEAGYPRGFAVTLHAPNDRYVNDERIAQAVASFLSRAGIETRVDAMPGSAFFARAGRLEFSLYMAGWGAKTGDTSSPLRALVATYDRATGMGEVNRGRFSDPGVDALIQSALVNADETKRNILLAAASDRAIGELQALVPLHHEVSTWALRRGLSYAGRADQHTLAHEIVPASR